MSNLLRSLTAIIVSQSLLFASLSHAEQLALPSGDLIAPQITHEVFKETIKAGSSQQIKATITDNVGVNTVTLFYRTIGSGDYKRVQMNQVDGTSEYVVMLGFQDTVEPGIEYYIQAVDLAGNALLNGYSFSPLKIGITSADTDAPATSAALVQTDVFPSEQDPKDESLGKNKTNKWLWIGLGVLAVGVVAAVASGGDDGGGEAPTAKTGSLTITAATP